jgi:hypothetical protein
MTASASSSAATASGLEQHLVDRPSDTDRRPVGGPEPDHQLRIGPVAELGPDEVAQLRDLQRLAVQRDGRPLFSAGTVAILATAADRPEDWVAAGQALQRMLLFATSCGLMFSQLILATRLLMPCSGNSLTLGANPIYRIATTRAVKQRRTAADHHLSVAVPRMVHASDGKDWLSGPKVHRSAADGLSHHGAATRTRANLFPADSAPS